MAMLRVADLVIGKRCSICLSEVEILSAAVVIPCRHVYCVGCIRRWSDCKRKCPLCVANFSSWLCTTDKGFREEKLLPLGKWKTANSRPTNEVLFRRRAQLLEQRRIIRRARESSAVASQARVLPRQRSFGRSCHESPDVIAERVRQWRASIYEHRLEAVPPSSKNAIVQRSLRNNSAEDTILRRIEPWIRRELQAILGDPDPTVIVHLVSSLFISRPKMTHENFQGQIVVQDDFLAPLRPFLDEWTDMFWHELRCFAESSLTMEAYDTIVVYRAVG